MTRTILTLLLSTAFTLGACQKNDTAADSNTLAVDNLTVGNADLGNASSTASLDSAFVTDGIKSDTAEVAIAQLAASKGSSQAVKDFANMLVTDHGAHKQKLVALANSAGVTVPTEPAEEGHANLLKLQKLSGAEFDKTFAQMLVDSHKKGIAKNEAQAKSSDPQTAAIATETLPVLRKHLAAAEALAK
jgi:putative membrane protein